MECISKDLGRKGEEMALKFLIGRGMGLVARNWRSGHKEFLRIVEVKSLSYPNEYDPFEGVNKKKRKRMVAAAHHFVMQKGIRKEVVFDVVSIVFNGNFYKLEYFGEAFSPCCL